MARLQELCAVVLAMGALSACGTYVPSKDIWRDDVRITDTTKDDYGRSIEGLAETNIVGNIRCEIGNAIYEASTIKSVKNNDVSYLYKSWGTQVTLKLTWDEISALDPGISFVSPMSNMRSKSVGVGGSVTAHASRVETITFIYENADLYSDEALWLQNKKDNPYGNYSDCSERQTGIMINSDLRISDFIVDKTTIASTGIANSGSASGPPFSTFQEDLTFVGAYSANVTPTWKLTRFTANTTGNLLSGTRTLTGDVLITLGPLQPNPDKASEDKFLHQLAEPAASQHNAGIIGSATATQVNVQSH